MIRVQSSFDKFENIAINSFYFLLRALLSLGLGFLTAKCTIFGELSPFSIILFSISSKVGLIPTFCFLGSSLGHLTNSIDLAVFKYITALTMLFIVYMVFEKSLHILKGDTAVLSATCCFTSGFLFLLAGSLNFFSVLLLICESVLICCCVFFVSYAAVAFRKCCYLSPRELIAAAVTLVLILLSLQKISFFQMNLARILAISVIFLSLYCLKMSHAAVLGGSLGIVLAAIGNGGESVFTATIVGTLVGCIFSSFSHRLAMGSFTIAYYAVLFFFGKFPWSYWLFSEPTLSMAIVFFLPKEKLKAFLSSYITVRSQKGETSNGNVKKVLEGCKQSCIDICPNATVCYSKNLQEISEMLETINSNMDNVHVKERLPFCIKPNTMSTIIQMQSLHYSNEDFDTLIKQINEVSKKMELKMNATRSPVHFFTDEEAAIESALKKRKLSIQNIDFFTDRHGCKKCEISFTLSDDILYEKIIRETVTPYFQDGYTIKTAENNGNYYTLIKENSTYTITCSALCKNKQGEQVCGDNALGFSLDKHTYCLLLADGMGSGEEARFQSKIAIDTFRKLLSGGLSPQNALNVYRSTERFRENEKFATIDMCIVNLKDGSAEFYKAGAFDSFHIHNDKLSVFHGGGMPLGLSEYERVKHHNFRFSDGDYLIMASDGIATLSNQPEAELLLCRHNDIRFFAQNILRRLTENSREKVSDDITIIVAKFQKSSE